MSARNLGLTQADNGYKKSCRTTLFALGSPL